MQCDNLRANGWGKPNLVHIAKEKTKKKDDCMGKQPSSCSQPCAQPQMWMMQI